MGGSLRPAEVFDGAAVEIGIFGAAKWADVPAVVVGHRLVFICALWVSASDMVVPCGAHHSVFAVDLETALEQVHFRTVVGVGGRRIAVWAGGGSG